MLQRTKESGKGPKNDSLEPLRLFSSMSQGQKSGAARGGLNAKNCLCGEGREENVA